MPGPAPGPTAAPGRPLRGLGPCSSHFLHRGLWQRSERIAFKSEKNSGCNRSVCAPGREDVDSDQYKFISGSWEMFELLQNVHLVQTKQQLLDMNYGTVAMVVSSIKI